MKEFFFAASSDDDMKLWMRALAESIILGTSLSLWKTNESNINNPFWFCVANPAVFGIDLRLAVAKGEQAIPVIIGLCLNTLATHFEVEGIFRVAGGATDVEQLRTQFDSGNTSILLKNNYDWFNFDFDFDCQKTNTQ